MERHQHGARAASRVHNFAQSAHAIRSCKPGVRASAFVLATIALGALAVMSSFDLVRLDPAQAQDAAKSDGEQASEQTPDARHVLQNTQDQGMGLPAELIRYPDVSAAHICFVYGGDIWIMPKSGGVAHRLTTAEGEETFPRFSPDGKQVAFTGNYDGNSDVYVISIDGGMAQRVTWHPDSERVVGWTPEGEVIFASIRTSETARVAQLFHIAPWGGDAERYPMPYGDFGAIAANGKVMAYVPWSRDFRTWKRYRGGMAPDIWLYQLEKHQAVNISKSDANESQPMWHGNKLYFLSDRGEAKRMNIWRYDLADKSFAQVTKSEDYDIHFPAIGPQEMVFCRAGKLYLMDLESEELSAVSVRVLNDQTRLRPRAIKAKDHIQHAAISPKGKRALFVSRGQIVTLPARHGFHRVLEGASWKADRYAEYAPNGEWIACFSDREGEYDLWLIDPQGQKPSKRVTDLGAGYRYRVTWSPDSTRVVFVDSTMTMHLVDVESGEHHEIDKGLWMYQGELNSFRVSWSPDSRWIAYYRGQRNLNGAIYLYDTQTHESTRATSAYYSDRRPVFGPQGDYLYYLSGRSIKPEYSDLDNTWIYPNSTQVMCVPLRSDVPSPLAPRNDSEAVADASDADVDDDEQENAGDQSAAAETESVEIELEGFESRAVILPLEAGNYRRLEAVKGKVLALRQPRTGSGDSDNTLVSWELKKRKEQDVSNKVSSFELAADRDHVLIRSGSNYTITKVGKGWQGSKDGGSGDQPWRENWSDEGPAQIDLSKVELSVDPMQEWKQIFADAWRIERDFFYDPGLHGVDWNAMRARYGDLVESCISRRDLEYLIGELIGELNASHTYRWGGDTENADGRKIGSLGADVRIALPDVDAGQGSEPRYQITRILRGAAWDAEARSPLDQPGLDVREGDYLLAINGQELDVRWEFPAHMQGLAGQTIELTLSADMQGSETRRVLVKPLGSDNRLRYLQWVEDRRAYVEEKSEGQIGYVYVPNTGVNGQNELVRQYRAQFHLPGMIIDERFNGGGQLPDRFVELLSRTSLNRWGVRDGEDWTAPFLHHDGPKAMLINGRAGSGGDAFPWYFKQAGLGPLIGTRTWGGLIGITGCPRLIDGGVIFAPTFGIYSNEGEWIIEGYGVDPDIEVVDDPAAYARGEDPQLDRAIAHVLNARKTAPPRVPEKPAYPDRSGR